MLKVSLLVSHRVVSWPCRELTKMCSPDDTTAEHHGDVLATTCSGRTTKAADALSYATPRCCSQSAHAPTGRGAHARPGTAPHAARSSLRSSMGEGRPTKGCRRRQGFYACSMTIRSTATRRGTRATTSPKSSVTQMGRARRRHRRSTSYQASSWEASQASSACGASWKSAATSWSSPRTRTARTRSSSASQAVRTGAS